MADRQYDGVFLDHIASLDRLAAICKDPEMLKAIYAERNLVILKLDREVQENGLYDSIK